MNEEKTVDRRVKKTKVILRNALLQLLMEKKINEITVKEICVLADVNRGTFYQYYHDIYAMFDAIQEEVIQEVMESITKCSEPQDVGTPEAMLPSFLEIFHYLSKNYEAASVLLNQDNNQRFFRRIAEVGQKSAVATWMKIYHIENREMVDFFYTFTVSGYIGIIKEWLNGGRKVDPEQLAMYGEQYIKKGLGMLENRTK